MPKVNTFNYDTIASWNGSEDLFVVEQPDGTKVATPAMVKQFMEAGNFEATGEVKDGHGNILKDMAKSAIIGDLSQTGLTGDSVAAQLGTAKGQISGITTGQKNEWFPDVYDYTTKIKTLTSSDCTTYVQKIGDLTIAWVYSLSASNWGNFSLMAQFRNFPNGCNWCLGGIVFNKNLQIQSSNIGVYFRPNVVGTFDDMFSCVLFFAKMS